MLSKLRAKIRNTCKIAPQAENFMCFCFQNLEQKQEIYVKAPQAKYMFLLSKLRAKTLLKSVADEQNIVFAFKHI